MITNVCLLLEMLSFTFCLHALYREKFRLDIVTMSFFVIYMIIMTAINYYNLPHQYTLIMYLIIFTYCGFKFSFDFVVILINMVLSVIIVGSIQMVVALPFLYVLNISWFTKLQLLIVDFLAFLIIVFVVPKSKVNKLAKFLCSKEKLQVIVIMLCIALVFFLLFKYKEFNVFYIEEAILLFISIVCIFILGGQLGKYKVKAKEIETELKMHELYADSFQGLIENIRLRQHEFDNHIHTIYSQHYIYNTYDELVEAQNTYCEVISKENCFNKLLKANNPIIAGFLYGKFVEIDKLGIDITYNVKIKSLDIDIPVYKIVEILGDLINNAVEAIENVEGMNKLYVSLIEDEKFTIEVRNESPYIDYNEIDNFFVKGYSSKGKNRGLGLHNIKKLCNEYKLSIYCENIKIDGLNWISFKVVKEREPSL